MRTFIPVVLISALYPRIRACVPTIPGGKPLTSCCRDDIFDNAPTGTAGRALFNPVLVKCPMNTEFICSVRLDLVTDPTMAIINGDTVVATGPGGMNAFVKLKCRESDKQWVTAAGQIVNKIGCINNASP